MRADFNLLEGEQYFATLTILNEITTSIYNQEYKKIQDYLAIIGGLINSIRIIASKAILAPERKPTELINNKTKYFFYLSFSSITQKDKIQLQAKLDYPSFQMRDTILPNMYSFFEHCFPANRNINCEDRHYC